MNPNSYRWKSKEGPGGVKNCLSIRPDTGSTPEGQEILEGQCGVLNSSKKQTKLFPDFCPSPKDLKWVK